MSTKIAIIGCGNLGESIANGLLKSGFVQPQHLILTKRNTEGLASFQQQGVVVTADNNKACREADIILVALKPYTILAILEDIHSSLNDKKCLVSLATGVTLDELSNAANTSCSIFRAMPNTATNVQSGVTAISTLNGTAEQSKQIQSIFEQLGLVIAVEENMLDAVTVLGACGIAYVMRFIRAMVQGGIQIGFSAEMAAKIVNQTVNGASELLLQGGAHPEAEIDKVTTPKGCTIVGLNEMEHHGFSSALIKGIVTSFKALEK